MKSVYVVLHRKLFAELEETNIMVEDAAGTESGR
jgi:hypothetical protein